MTKRFAAAALLTLAVALPMRADFNSLVRAVETIPGLRRMPIPGIGLVRFAVWMIHPKGVYDFQLATFEGDGGDIDQRQLESLLRQHATDGYRPLVQAHSRRSGELTLIWARPQGERIELLLMTHERRDETVVLRAVVDVETVAREIADPQKARYTGKHIASR